jgi:hypothetical protein
MQLPCVRYAIEIEILESRSDIHEDSSQFTAILCIACTTPDNTSSESAEKVLDFGGGILDALSFNNIRNDEHQQARMARNFISILLALADFLERGILNVPRFVSSLTTHLQHIDDLLRDLDGASERFA